jgi:predicted acylesterase/phospholipase RssA
MSVSNIKHLVIAGGAHAGFAYYGAFKSLIDNKFIVLSEIQTVFSTSVGGILAVILLLNYDWDTLDEYLVNRPWHLLFKTDLPTLINGINKGGVYDVTLIKDVLTPLLLGKDLSPLITLEEFNQYTQKDLHFISTKFHNLEICDISHKTHPGWKLVDAICASSCLPVVFAPFEQHDDEIYIDGAIHANYPLPQCMAYIGDSGTKEIFGIVCGFHEEVTDKSKKPKYLQESTTFRLFYFLLDLFLKLWSDKKKNDLKTDEPPDIHQLEIFCHAKDALQIIKSADARKKMISFGIESAEEFIKALT